MRQAGAANADSLDWFGDLAPSWAEAGPLPPAGNPDARWNPPGAAAFPLPAQQAACRNQGAAERVCLSAESRAKVNEIVGKAVAILLGAASGFFAKSSSPTGVL